jgi:putative ABC transport system permease protein
LIRIAGVPFRVVGVSAKKGAFFGNSLDEFVVIPLGQYQKLFGSRQSLALMVKPRDAASVALARDEARTALRVARHLGPGEPDNFGIVASDSILDIFQQATKGIAAVLVGVVALSLLVGGIVIMNIMLMVVSERTREIGLRKALGARGRDIMSQVLTESITLSMTGGLVGVALGAVFAKGLAAVTPLPAAVELWSVAVGVLVTGVVGLFFGWYPARRAASLAPIEALRRE